MAFLKLVRHSLFLFSLLLVIQRGNQVLAQSKPNILWITIEDTSPHFIGCYGNEHASTPHIDQLAKEGIRFQNAFSTGTVCSPSRFTLITGVRTYAAGTGNHRSHYPIPDFIKGFPSYLKQAGYYTTNNVKTDYNTSEEKRIIEESWNENSNQAGWWNRKPGQPFFAIFNFMESHQSRTMTYPYEKYQTDVLDQLPAEAQIGENDFDMPPFYHDTPAMRKQVARVYNSLKLTDNLIGDLLDRLQQDQLMDSTIIFFYADHGEGIPRGKTNGIGMGYRVPFVIWFPPMYRDLSPWNTGVVTDELVNFADLQPTLLSLAGVEIPDYMTGRALLGPERKESNEFIFMSNDRSDEGDDLVRSCTNGKYLYSRNFMPFMAETRWIKYQEVSDIKKEMRKDFASGKLSETQKNMFLPRPAEFLYDLENDPWELHNLADDPNLQNQLTNMREAVENNILETRDILFLPDYELANISKTTTPYEYRLNEKAYPIQEIYAAASLSGKRDQETIEKQIELLMHTNKIVRYWAALGLKSQKYEQLKSYQQQLTQAMQDSYPPVQIVAAALCFDVFESQAAQTQLEKFVKDKDEELALMALQHIAYLQDIQPFAKAIQQIISNKNKTENYALQSAAVVLLDRLGLVEMKL